MSKGKKDSKLEVILTTGVPKSIWRRDKMTTRFEVEYQYDKDGNLTDMIETDLETGLKKKTTFTYKNGNLSKEKEVWVDYE